MNKDLKKKKGRGRIESAACSLQSSSDPGTEADIYKKTDLCMKLADCEQSCCLSKHTHAALRGGIRWQRRCYSVCKTLIPLPRFPLPSRVSSHGSGLPAASGAAKHQGWAINPAEFPVLARGCFWKTPRDTTRVPGGQPCRQGTRGPAAPCPAKGSRTASPPRENPFPFVHLLCERVTCSNPQPDCLGLLWGQNQTLALYFHPSHLGIFIIRDYNLFLPHS